MKCCTNRSSNADPEPAAVEERRPSAVKELRRSASQPLWVTPRLTLRRNSYRRVLNRCPIVRHFHPLIDHPVLLLVTTCHSSPTFAPAAQLATRKRICDATCSLDMRMTASAAKTPVVTYGNHTYRLLDNFARRCHKRAPGSGLRRQLPMNSEEDIRSISRRKQSTDRLSNFRMNRAPGPGPCHFSDKVQRDASASEDPPHRIDKSCSQVARA